jgi:hypothetical protein
MINMRADMSIKCKEDSIHIALVEEEVEEK